MYYKSQVQKFSCKNHYGVELFKHVNENKEIEVHNVTTYEQQQSSTTNNKINKKVSKRDVYPGLNGETYDGGAKESLT